MKFKLGMTSVTFRKKNIDEIIAITKKAGLDGIEWGSDIHVPVGDIKNAQEVYEKTTQNGLEVFSYGSYYHGDYNEDFDSVLKTAKALHAPIIRVWAGRKTFEESSIEEITRLAKQFKENAEAAQAENIELAFEYHRDTATQTKEGAIALKKLMQNNNAFLYWQPNPDISHQEQLAEIDLILPYLRTIHVFYWTNGSIPHLLEEGKDRWLDYISHIKKSGRSHNFLLEFVKNDSDESFLSDAKTLRELLKISCGEELL